MRDLMAVLRSQQGKASPLPPRVRILPAHQLSGPFPSARGPVCPPPAVLTSVSVQREHQKKLEQTIEEMKQEETSALKRQQALKASPSLDGFVGGELGGGGGEGEHLQEGRDRVPFQVVERIKEPLMSIAFPCGPERTETLSCAKRLVEVAVSAAR